MVELKEDAAQGSGALTIARATVELDNTFWRQKALRTVELTLQPVSGDEQARFKLLKYDGVGVS